MKKTFLILIILGFFYYPIHNIQAKTISFIGIDEVQNQKVGNQVKLRGIVSVLPNTIGKQFFYITNNTNSVQVYSYKKNFPNLDIGNIVEVNGEISISNNIKRIKTKTLSDIRVLNENMNVIVKNVRCSDLSKQNINSLVHIEGDVLDKKGRKIYIDDETGEAIVYIKTASNINIKSIETNDRLLINGIIENVKGEIRIIPRDQNDISIQKKEIIKKEISVDSINNKNSIIEVKSRNNKRTKYILIILITTTLIVIIKQLKRKKKFFFERK